MKIQGEHQRSLVFDASSKVLNIIDQTRLPFTIDWLELSSLNDCCLAISSMQVRGAPAIGIVAAFGVAYGLAEGLNNTDVVATLKATRPTAVNLAWAVDRVADSVQGDADAAFSLAQHMAEEDVKVCEAIGEHGLSVIEAIAERNAGGAVNILTHCNAGWLATVDWGTALSPIYKAVRAGIDVHVWVDETRPRNQGALLTAFELQQEGIPHTLIVDNAGGHLMQHGKVDLCLAGSDRTTANGDVCNKIGTYLKALAAAENNVPFYVALPSSTIDMSLAHGRDVPIEYRCASEVLSIMGPDGLTPVTVEGVQAINPAFDVTPAKYVSGLITEKGVIDANEQSIAQMMAL